jgi:hypothetical protein
VPSVSFSARDSKGNDLPDTQVFVDGQLVASRLDDGKAHDLDPGKHTVRFVRNGKESTVNVVIAVGDKGRNITTVLGGDGSSSSSSSSSSASTPSDGDKGSSGPSRPVFPLVVAGLGGAALATGVVLTFVGLGNVPNQCTTSPRECAAAPKDPVFDEAKSAINLANLGIGIGIAGLVIGVGGLIWYFSNSPTGGTASASFSSSSSSASSAKVFRSVATGTIAF